MVPTRRALLALAVSLSTATLALSEEAPGRLEQNKALVRRYVEQVLSAGDLTKVGELVAEGYVDATPGTEATARGPEVVKSAVERAHAAFGNVRYVIDELLAEGDVVLARYTVRATFRGGEGEQDDKPVEISGMTIFRLTGDKIREAWTINDQLKMFEQIGYTLTPPTPRDEEVPAEPKP